MKVIRQVCYEGTEAELRTQLANSMPEGKSDVRRGNVTIDVRTVYSELPELPPFVGEAHDFSPDYQVQTVRDSV